MCLKFYDKLRVYSIWGDDFYLFVIFEVFVVCIVVVGVKDGVEVLLVVWGLGGFCEIGCCCVGVDIGMKIGVDGIGGMFESVEFGIMILGCMVDGVGSFGCMGWWGFVLG